MGVSAKNPLYVKEISKTDNTVVLCENDGLLAQGLIAELEGDKVMAINMYKQAIMNKKNCYTAKRHLKLLEDKM